MYVTPEDGLYYRNMQHVLTRLLKAVVVDSRAYVNCKQITTYKDNTRIILQ